MIEGKSSFTFFPCGLLKHSKPNVANTVIKLMAYPVNRSLCIVTVLREYLLRTSSLRKNQQGKLLISYQKPHKEISRDTLARWVKLVLQKSEIDVSVFKPHSTRAASTSAAKQASVPLVDIMKAASWSSSSTFATYYDKYICKDSFARGVLSRVS